MPVETLTDDDGGKWISHEALCVGDYGGAGSVGEANIRFLERQYQDTWTRRGSHGFRQAWLPDTEEFRELVGWLGDYPLFDDEIISEVESDWESDAWNSYLRSDLIRTLPDCVQDYVDDALTDEDVFGLYRSAMKRTNTYVTPEYNGVYVPTERIEGAFGELCAERAMKDESFIVGNLTALECPVRECDRDSLLIALDWAQDTQSDDSFFDLLREWLEVES